MYDGTEVTYPIQQERSKPLTEEEKEAIIALRLHGATYAEIASAVNHNLYVVEKFCQENDLTGCIANANKRNQMPVRPRIKATDDI